MLPARCNMEQEKDKKGKKKKLDLKKAGKTAANTAAGAAIALALQGSLANVASGVILMATRPFRLGDWITVVGIVLGVLGCLGGLINTFRTLNRIGHSPEDEPPKGFNDHD